jgi:hypothetical protein
MNKKVLAVLAPVGLLAGQAQAAFVTVAAETGVVTWDPTELVIPILTIAGTAIAAGVGAWLLFKGLSVVMRMIRRFV